MRLRSRRRHPEEPIDPLLPEFLEDGHHARHPSRWAGEPEALLASRETRELVRACLDRLPADYRTVIVLRDVEELSTEEAARFLGISEGACKVRLHRARQALRGLLAPHFERCTES
jgi:RNA polymerase sigma-70 factor (ECF subfamily)